MPLVMITRILALCLAAAPASAEAVHGTGRAIDGDTLAVGGVHVRLKGVAAPELAPPGLHIAGGRGGRGGAASVRGLVDGREVACDLTGERTHGRRVGYCSAGGRDVGRAVIAAGLARACPRYSTRYVADERPEAARLPFPGYCRPK